MNDIHYAQMTDARKIQRLDLNLLKVFASIYREKNMTRAAQSLYLTPSAVSHAMKRLRIELGDPLFERKGRDMLPTAACEQLAPRLMEVLHQLEQILQNVGAFDPQETRQTFTIAVPTLGESALAPKLIREIAPLLPKARLAIVGLNRRTIDRQLASGEIALAIDVGRPARVPIFHTRLFSGPFAVLARKGRFQAEITVEAYLAAEHVAVSNRRAGPVMEDFPLLERGYNRKVKLRCQTYQTARDVVADSDLFLTLPTPLAMHLNMSGVERLAMPIALPDPEANVYWHETWGRDPSVVWLREKIIAALR